MSEPRREWAEKLRTVTRECLTGAEVGSSKRTFSTCSLVEPAGFYNCYERGIDMCLRFSPTYIGIFFSHHTLYLPWVRGSQITSLLFK